MLQALYNEAQSGLWAHFNPFECGCKGSGWHLSQVDTWHKCRIHNPKAPHPEAYDNGEECDGGNTVVQEARIAYKAYGNLSGMTPKAFNAKVKHILKKANLLFHATPEYCLWAAQQVVGDHE